MATKQEAVYSKFHQIVGVIKSRFVGRHHLIDTIALALLCKQHAFLVSPPGTAKTAIIRRFADLLDMSFFGVQMRDDTKVEEILGMWDITELEKGRYVRKWARMAKAEIAYMNECFKGSSNALNSALGLLHEREVDDEDGYHPVPLWSAFLDSNELPRDQELLAAFFDRILFKLPIKYLTESDEQDALLSGGAGGVIDPKMKIGRADLQLLLKCVSKVGVYDEVKQDVIAIRGLLKLEGVVVSDRTLAEACGIDDPDGNPRATPIRAAAFYRGSNRVESKDLFVLEDIFWTDPKQRPKIKKAIIRIVAPARERAEDLLDKLIDARVSALESNGTVDNALIADAVALALDTKRELKKLDSLSEEDMTEYLGKVSAIHAELSGKIMRM